MTQPPCLWGGAAADHNVVKRELLLVLILVEINHRGRSLFGCSRVRRTVTRDRLFDLSEEGLSLRVINTLSKRQLTDEDLAGLAQHALLTSRQSLVLVATPQVTNNLSNLVDVTGAQTFLVRLVPTRPVTCLLNVRLTQHGEDLQQACLSDHVTHADKFSVGRRNLNPEITLEDLQDEVIAHFPVELALSYFLNLRRTVVRINDRIADLEIHLVSTPLSTTSQPITVQVNAPVDLR